MPYKMFAAGYLVKDDKVLLVHSRKYDNWVPPGGHIEDNETPDETLAREFLEETGLKVKVLSYFQNGITGDSGRMPLAIPFHVSLLTQDFDSPRIGYFYFVEVCEAKFNLQHQQSEHFSIGWFDKQELENIKTYEQVRKESRFALENYPRAK